MTHVTVSFLVVKSRIIDRVRGLSSRTGDCIKVSDLAVENILEHSVEPAGSLFVEAEDVAEFENAKSIKFRTFV